ncbi:MAG: helix-turn-helix domain-containing protein [Mycobacteriales bacterium]
MTAPAATARLDVRQPDFGHRLRRLRRLRGLSQRTIARGVVTASYVSLLESGARVPTLGVVVRLAGALDVPLAALVDDHVAAALPGPAGQPAWLAGQLPARGAVAAGDLEVAAGLLTEAYAAVRLDGSPALVLATGLALQDVLRETGRCADRLALLRELTAVAEGTGLPDVAVAVYVDRAESARGLGLLAEAADFAERAVARVGDSRLAGTVEHLRAVEALVQLRCDAGRAEEVPGLVEQALALAGRIGSPAAAGRAHRIAGLGLARIGRADLALAHVRPARAVLAPWLSVREWAHFCCLMASILLDCDAEPAQVAGYLAVVHLACDTVELPEQAAQLRALDVRQALAAGDTHRAVLLSEAEPAGLGGVELARFRLARGRALYRTGRGAGAVQVLRSAAELCEQLAAYPLAALIWRELDAVRSGLTAPTAR